MLGADGEKQVILPSMFEDGWCPSEVSLLSVRLDPGDVIEIQNRSMALPGNEIGGGGREGKEALTAGFVVPGGVNPDRVTHGDGVWIRSSKNPMSCG